MNIFLENDDEEETVEVQDNTREKLMKVVFRLLNSGEGRNGLDALHRDGHRFELKSTTTLAFPTARDLSLETLDRWVQCHWIFGYGKNYKSGFRFLELYYYPPSKMYPLLLATAKQLQKRVEVANLALDWLKHSEHNTPENIRAMKFIVARGTKMNNTKLPLKRVRKDGYRLEEPYAECLDSYIMKYGDDNGRSIQRNFAVYITDEDTLPL